MNSRPTGSIYIQVENAGDGRKSRFTELVGDVCVQGHRHRCRAGSRWINDDQKGTFTIFEPAG